MIGPPNLFFRWSYLVVPMERCYQWLAAYTVIFLYCPRLHVCNEMIEALFQYWWCPVCGTAFAAGLYILHHATTNERVRWCGGMLIAVACGLPFALPHADWPGSLLNSVWAAVLFVVTSCLVIAASIRIVITDRVTQVGAALGIALFSSAVITMFVDVGAVALSLLILAALSSYGTWRLAQAGNCKRDSEVEFRFREPLLCSVSAGVILASTLLIGRSAFSPDDPRHIRPSAQRLAVYNAGAATIAVQGEQVGPSQSRQFEPVMFVETVPLLVVLLLVAGLNVRLSSSRQGDSGVES